MWRDNRLRRLANDRHDVGRWLAGLYGSVERGHRQDQAGAAELLVDDPRIKDVIGDILAGEIGVGPRPDVRRRQTAARIAEAVVLLEQRQDAADRPILVSRGVSIAAEKRSAPDVSASITSSVTTCDMA